MAGLPAGPPVLGRFLSRIKLFRKIRKKGRPFSKGGCWTVWRPWRKKAGLWPLTRRALAACLALFANGPSGQKPNGLNEPKAERTMSKKGFASSTYFFGKSPQAFRPFRQKSRFQTSKEGSSNTSRFQKMRSRGLSAPVWVRIGAGRHL